MYVLCVHAINGPKTIPENMYDIFNFFILSKLFLFKKIK